MKKKIIALIVAVLVVAGVAAFFLLADPFNTPEPTNPTSPSNQTDPTDPSTPSSDPTAPGSEPTDPSGDTNPTNPVETGLTEATVRNHPVAPESDFTYRSENGGIMITSYRGNDTIVVIPETINGTPVTSISRTAFHNGTTVKALLIPSGVRSVEPAAFMNNNVLEIVVWDSASLVQADVFCGCGNLRLLVLGNDVSSIGEYAFFGCFELTIKVVPGSYMETYCKDHNLPYTTE